MCAGVCVCVSVCVSVCMCVYGGGAVLKGIMGWGEREKKEIVDKKKFLNLASKSRLAQL